jgi:tRNA(Arg) A34 adenosine deaminase TadA
MKEDNANENAWRVTLGSIFGHNTAQLDGKLFAGLIGDDKKLLDLTVYYLIAAQQVMIDPVSLLLMNLYQMAGKARIGNFTFAICAPRAFPISIEAMGLIQFFEATQNGRDAVHFTRLDYNTVVPQATQTVWTLKAAELTQIPKPIGDRIPDLLVDFDLTENIPSNEKVHRLYMAAAFALVNQRFKVTGSAGYDIGAILVSGRGQILSYGLNISREKFFVHAELMAIYEYFRRTGNVELPSDCRLYTTLKPCKMCAAYIVGRLPTRPAGFKIYHGHNDRGGPASNTELDRLNASQQAPQVSVLIGSDGSKPLRSYVTTQYVADDKAAHRHWVDAAQELSKIQYNSGTRQGIVVQLASKAPSEFPKIVNSLLRKGQKYKEGAGTNANVSKALVHIIAFLESLGVMTQGTLASLSIAEILTEEEWRQLDEAIAQAEEYESKKARRELEEAGPSASNGDLRAQPFVLDEDERDLGRQLKRYALPSSSGLPGLPGLPGRQGGPNAAARPAAAEGQDEFQ